jgi:hypothetical protein
MLLDLKTIQNIDAPRGRNVEFLGAFIRSPKSTISFFMSVCLSVDPHGATRLPSHRF